MAMGRPPPPPPAYEISFGVEARLGHGEVIYVCGSCPSLGSKDPSRALRLVTDPTCYPLWSSDPVSVPLEKKVTYRYCVVAGGKFKRWEDISHDRELDPVTEPSKAPVMVEDVLDKYKGKGGGILSGFGLFRGALPKGDMSRSIKYTAANRSSLQASKNALRAKTVAKEQSSAITTRDGVVVVSFFLPVLVTKSADGKWAVEWDYENLLSVHSSWIDMRVTRVGFVRHLDGITPQEEEEVAKALEPFSCVPVFLETSVATKFYRDFCKGVLWPVFHHVVDVYGDLVMRFFNQDTLADLWQCYANVNRRFRDRIVEVYNEGDMVWVHGFHLLLLPSFLTRVLRTARVGLFLHTPFPSSEIFRTLPFREDLLRGMLNADKVGFHLYEYTRHFLTCCKRILGLNEGDSSHRGNTNVFYNGRCVAIESMHGGIEPSIITDYLTKPAIKQRAEELREEFGGRFVFFGIDKVERLKGLQLKFTAFYKLLLECPHLRDKVVLLQLGVSVNEREQDYNKCLTELNKLADKVNSECAPAPDRPVLIFQLEDETAFTLHKRLPYMCLADCLVNTAVRDGLNNLALEYVCVHEATRKEDPGVMLLSEFTSCMRVMRGAIRINPWKVEEVARVMAEVVELMTPDWRRERLSQGVEYVTSNTTSFWAATILTDLKAVGRSADRSILAPVGLGLNFRVIGMESSFTPLDVSVVMRSYRPAKRRVIVLDYGGTVCATAKRSITYFAHATKLMSLGKPPESLTQLLTTLCEDPRNLVFVITGREKDELDGALGDIKNLGLAAEHGLHFRYPGECVVPGGTRPFARRKWEHLVALRDQSWKQLARMIMDLYVQRTHGTYVVNKGSAILWQFRDADPEFGWLQSKELEDHLTTVLKPFSVEILRSGGSAEGNGGYIEVRPGGVNKGAFVSAILSRQVEMGLMPDFVLVVGDEESDEMMYEAVKDFSRGVKGEAPGTPETVATAAQSGQMSPGRRGGSYQIGATAAVLIASAAAELKRHQEEYQEHHEENDGYESENITSSTSRAFAASAPPNIDAAITIMAGLEAEPIAEEKTAPPSSAGAGPGEEGEEDGDEVSEDAGSRPRSQSEHLEKVEKRPLQLSHLRDVRGGTERWRESMLGGSRNSRDGVGSPLDVKCFTCTVGKKPSQAQNYVNDVDEVLELLRGLVKVSSSVARNYSTSHLTDARQGVAGISLDYDQLSYISTQYPTDASVGLEQAPQSMMHKSLSVVVMPTHLLPVRTPTAPRTMTAYFNQIEEEEEDDGIFF